MAAVKNKDDSVWNVLLVVMIIVLVVYIAIGFRDPSKIPANQEQVLQGMRSTGFMFDSTLVKVTLSNNETQAIVTGPMIGLKEIPAAGSKLPEQNSQIYTQYKEVDLEKQNGNWVVANGVKR
jgi:hypothetical protein